MKSFLEIEPEYSAYGSSKVVVIPVPYEATTSYGKGTKNGPSAILEASQIVEDYDIELGYEPYKKLGICTVPPVKLGKYPHDDIYKSIKGIISSGKLPLMLGGEHSVTFGAVKAAKEKYDDLSVLQFDAHADLRDTYHGSGFSHACIMRRVRELCKAVQVGIRSQDIDETAYLTENGLTGSMFYAEKFDESRIPAIVNQLAPNVYISFDVDALDSSIMPATGTPEPGGLNWHQALAVLKAVISARNIVGIDVVELSPIKGLHYPDYTVAKLIYKMIGYISQKS